VDRRWQKIFLRMLLGFVNKCTFGVEKQVGRHAKWYI
jgi:hypothetical protein